ncbi:MAG: transposase [Magnetococcales bacterium]|nr:transposase [Magnetococcales bacterium]
MSSIKCPLCGGRPARIYKCTACGEVRCGQNTCGGNKGGPKGWASAGSQCRTCNAGRYGVLDFFSKEMSDLQRESSGSFSDE